MVTRSFHYLPKGNQWIFRLLNGQEITPSPKYKVESKGNVNILTIPKVDLIDTGVYEVVVSNGLETIKATSKLDVCVKPKVVGKRTELSHPLFHSPSR